MISRLFAMSLVASLLGAAGCQRGITPEIEWGVTKCHRCNTAIADRTWAAADRAAGAIRVYDDPGCLFSTRRQEDSSSLDAVFADHLGGERWLAAADVWLAKTTASQSPQGYGWAAYADFAAAQDAVTRGGSGRILRFAEALRALPSEP
jgi:hypothetical protein